MKSIEICPENPTCNPVSVPFKGVSPVLFAIPRGLKPSVYDIIVTYSGSKNEQPDTSQFTVVSGTRPARIDSLELGVNRLTDGTATGLQLILFGSGFDLVNHVKIGQNEYPLTIPGIDYQRLIWTTPLARDLPEMCGRSACAELVRVAVIDEADVGPGLHDITLLDGNKQSLNPPVSRPGVEFPQLTLLAKLDRIKQSYGGPDDTPPWPLILASRADAMASLGQTFSALGYRIDLWQGKDLPFSIARESTYDCPLGDGKMSPGMEISDVIDIARSAGGRPRSGVSPESWYIHTSILTHLVPDSGFTAYGLYVTGLPDSRLDHEEVAVFSRSVCDQLSLRTLMHELGHALDLTHCDGDSKGLTIMNQTQCIDENQWNFQFSPRATVSLMKLAQSSAQSIQTSTPSSSSQEVLGSCCLMSQPPGVLPDLSKLTFTLTAPVDIISGDTINLTGNLLNTGEKPVTILPFFDPAYSLTSYVITKVNQDGSSTTSRYTPILSFDGKSEPLQVNPGIPFEGDAVVSSSAAGYTFVPGKYQIQGFFHGVLSSSGEPSGEVASNVLAIQVRAPKPGAEAALSTLLMNSETQWFLLAHGGETYGDLPQRLVTALGPLLQNNEPSRLAQKVALILGEYYNRSGATMTDTPRPADYKKALAYLGSVARGPQLSKSANILFHTEKALALGALGDRDGSNDELEYLKKLSQDPHARWGLDRVNRILNIVGETNLGVDFSLLQDRLAQSCDEKDWQIEPIESTVRPMVKVAGTVAQLAMVPAVSSQGVDGLTLLGRNSTEALYAIGLKAPAGLEVKSSALRLRVKVRSFQILLSLENLALPSYLSEAKVELPLQLPCFLSGAVKGLNIPIELDAKSMERIEQWDQKGSLSLDLKVTLPPDLIRFGAKVGGPIALSPP